MISPQWLVQSISRTNVHGLKDAWATEVELYHFTSLQVQFLLTILVLNFNKSMAMCPLETEHMKCQILFSWNHKKNIILSSAELSQRVVQIKWLDYNNNLIYEKTSFLRLHGRDCLRFCIVKRLSLMPSHSMLGNIDRHLFTTRNQSSGKQPRSRDVMRSRSQSDDGSRWESKLSQFPLAMFEQYLE